MTKILSVDTCLSACSVAIHEEEKLLGENFLDAGLTHSQTLMPMIQSLLDSLGMKFKEIDVFGVTNGPGSFTGMRIGMATVKGMALAFDKPCVTVSTLYALAMGAINLEGIVCPCIDARNKQIYNAVFRICKSKIERITKNRAINIEDFINELKEYKENIIFVGDGAKICYNVAKTISNKSDITLMPEEFNRIRAGRFGEEVYRQYKSGIQYSCEEISLEYIKLSQAERELAKAKSEKGGI